MRARACILLFALLCTAPGADKPKLFVYVPSSIRPAVFEKKLQKVCPSLNVTFYGQHRRLSKAIRQASPEGIISLEPVIDQTRYDMFERALVGMQDGKNWETYLLLSREAIDLTKLDQLDIGVVDILSRRKMQEMLSEMLEIQTPQYTPVSKVSDLLSLLQVKQADGILVRKELVKTYFRRRTEMQLIDNVLPKAKMGLPVLVTIKGLDPAQKKIVVDAIKALGPEMNTQLGVELWKEAP